MQAKKKLPRAARKSKVTHFLEYAALRIALGFFGLMDLDRASAVGGWLGRTVGPRIGITNRARKNIALAMPELDKSEIERIVTAMWDNLGHTIAEYAHLDEFGDDPASGRIEIVNHGIARGIISSGKGAIFVSGHFANWELLPLVLRFNGMPSGEVYRHANNPFVNEWMVAMRERVTHAQQIPKGGPGARVIVRLIREAKSIAMLVDQKMNDGIAATMFGQRAMTTAAPAGLVMRYGIPVVPAYIERLEGSRFRVTLYEPILANPDAEPIDDIQRITQALNDFIEERIRERPEQWLWLHDRWSEPAWIRKRKAAEAAAAAAVK